MTKRTVPPADFKKIKLTPGHAVAGETRRVPVTDVHVLENLNLRVKGTTEYDQAVDEFAASIAANGFYDDKPLAGYIDGDDRVIVVDGHRRLEAIQRLNNASLDGDVVSDVPVVLKPENATLADLTVAMIQSSSGKDLTMFEKGLGVRRLMADGMDKPEIARRLAVSEKTIDNYLIVASVPAKARDLLLDDKVTSTQVLRAKGDADKLSAMVAKATAAGRTRARPSDAAAVEQFKDEQVAKLSADRMTEPLSPVAREEVERVTGMAHNGLAYADDPNTFTVAIVKDADMGAVMRQIAAEIRKVVPHDQGDDDTARVDGVVTVSVSLTQPKPVKRARKGKAAVEDGGEAQAPQPATAEPVPSELAHAVVDDL